MSLEKCHVYLAQLQFNVFIRLNSKIFFKNKRLGIVSSLESIDFNWYAGVGQHRIIFTLNAERLKNCNPFLEQIRLDSNHKKSLVNPVF